MLKKIVYRFSQLLKKNLILLGVLVAVSYMIIGTLWLTFDGTLLGSREFFSEIISMVFGSIIWGLLAIGLAFLGKDRMETLRRKQPVYQALVYFLWFIVMQILLEILRGGIEFFWEFEHQIGKLLFFSVVGSVLATIFFNWRLNKESKR